jgi:retron-type reverse transcriptase
MSDIIKTQRSFAKKAMYNPKHRFSNLYRIICQEEWIQTALNLILRNKGAKTAGIDGVTKKAYAPLGIATIKDRVVQMLVKMILEPIWESDFLNCSNGFRPGRRTMDCIALLDSYINNRSKYYWIIEGDIKGAFDHIHHEILVRLLTERIVDQRLLQLDLYWWNKYGSLNRKEKERRRIKHQGNCALIRYADDCAPRTLLKQLA